MAPKPDASLLGGSFSPAGGALLEPAAPVIDAGGAGCGVIVGDLNGDGRPDAALGSDDGDDLDQLTVLLNQGDGSFAAAAPIMSVARQRHEFPRGRRDRRLHRRRQARRAGAAVEAGAGQRADAGGGPFKGRRRRSA